jgi:hypothetical protein
LLHRHRLLLAAALCLSVLLVAGLVGPASAPVHRPARTVAALPGTAAARILPDLSWRVPAARTAAARPAAGRPSPAGAHQAPARRPAHRHRAVPVAHRSKPQHVRRKRSTKRVRPHRHLARRSAHPGFIVQGHYLRSLVGRTSDRGRMWRLGAHDATRNPGGMPHLVLLDIGGQSRRGVYLSIVNRFVGYRPLADALSAYVAGYHARQRRNAPVTIALGTNSDLYTSAGAGWLWATQVVNRVRAAASRYRGVTVAGADDIEPGFRAKPGAALAWLGGYLHSTRAPLVFNGSADGCSTTHAWSRCNDGWSAHALALAAGGASPARIVAVPQIYNAAMAAQWAQISRTARQAGRSLRILGPLTEQAACGRDPGCPSMPNPLAWRLLHRQLRAAGVQPSALPFQIDLDVR